MGIRYTYAESESFRTEPVLVEKTITTNGSYDAASDNADGYSVVNVNVEGGGSSWQTVFEGSVTTVSDDPAPIGSIENLSLNADTIKVTFNGTEYECNKHADGSYGASFDESTEQFNWSTYPFALANLSAGNHRVDIYTETAGTYTLKIEEEQSGGSSDFSTAEVTVINTSSEYANTLKGSIVIDSGSEFGTTYEMDISVSQTITANVIMYKGNSIVFISDVESTSGAIQSIGGNRYLITGDCTITIS